MLLEMVFRIFLELGSLPRFRKHLLPPIFQFDSYSFFEFLFLLAYNTVHHDFSQAFICSSFQADLLLCIRHFG